MEGADDATIQSYMNEIALLQRLQYSSRVIRMYDHEYNQQTNTLYVVMERGDTDLATLLRDAKKRNQISEVMQKFYFSEMLEAVNVLHKEGRIIIKGSVLKCFFVSKLARNHHKDNTSAWLKHINC